VQKSCNQCGTSFEITQAELDFYDKISPVFNGKKELIPPPTLCPECRTQRRMAWRNERHLFHRDCSLCGKSIVALYRPETPFPVYCISCFFGDGWDPNTTGRTFDASRPFFDQVRDLQESAPRIALLSKNSENSDFTNHSADNRNCYLSTIVFNSEDVLHSRKIFRSKSIVDCAFLYGECELAYECFWGNNLYHSSYLQNCYSLNDCHFCIDCRNCSFCLLCSNQRNKRYCILNEQLTKEEYSQRATQWMDGDHSSLMRATKEFDALRRTHAIFRNLEITNCEGCSGDYLLNCKNVRDCYYMSGAEDMRHCIECDPSRSNTIGRDSMDVFGFGSSELLYEVQAQANGYGNVANNFSYDVKHCLYIDNCHDAEECFGCIGLRRKKFCILNKQYTKQEYERLMPKIIGHMRKTNEWGEFFPVTLSPFPYNETIACEDYPLVKNEVKKRGWKWREEKDEMPKVSKVIPAKKLPDSIEEIPDDILNWAIECEVTKRPFKIIRQELDFYRTMKLPIPRFHPDERHRRRMALRNPRKLWKRSCMKCRKEMETTYAPERPETVYCENCYLKEVY